MWSLQQMRALLIHLILREVWHPLPINPNRKNSGIPILKNGSKYLNFDDMPHPSWNAIMKMKRRTTSPQHPWMMKYHPRSQCLKGTCASMWLHGIQKLSTPHRQMPTHMNPLMRQSLGRKLSVTYSMACLTSLMIQMKHSFRRIIGVNTHTNNCS